MQLLGQKKLEKLKKKKKNNKLSVKIDELINDIERNNWTTKLELKETIDDADCVHSDGFYIFNIETHRTMILIEFEEQEAEVVWVGSHDEYELTFKNNKNTVAKWLRNKGWIL